MDVLEYTASMTPKEAFILGMLLNKALNKSYRLWKPLTINTSNNNK